MITIQFNHQKRMLVPGYSLQQLLTKEQCIDQPMAVAINNQLIPRSLYSNTWLQEGDCIDIIIPMQGG